MNMAGLLIADVILLSGAAFAGALGGRLAQGMGKVRGATDDQST